MAVNARTVALLVLAKIKAGSHPEALVTLIARELEHADGLSAGLAAERAEVIAERTLTVIRKMHDTHVEKNMFKAYTFNSSDDSFLQGIFFVEPQDDEETAASKNRRSQLLEVRGALECLTPEGFERLCKAILTSFDPLSCDLTKYRSDQGIDFYAKVRWLPPLLSGAVDIEVFSRFDIWIVGQAKRYLDSKVSTPDLRELVGAVELARAGAYSLAGDRYPDLKMRLCDPVYYLFMTTGDLSSETVELAGRSGVIALDGFGVSELVAHMNLGFSADGLFDEALFLGLLDIEDDSPNPLPN